jgi:hypothetical protein
MLKKVNLDSPYLWESRAPSLAVVDLQTMEVVVEEKVTEWEIVVEIGTKNK